MTSNSNTYFFLGAAVVGIVSAAGMFIVEHLQQKRRRHVLTQNLARIDQQLSCMQLELDQLRKLQKEKHALKPRKRKAKSIVSTSSDGTEVDSSDLEFYDLSDDDDGGNTITPIEVSIQLIDEKFNEENLDSFTQVLAQLSDLCIESPENPQLLWRLGKAHYKIANISPDLDVKNYNIERGIVACQSALNTNSQVGEAHKWIATLIGLQSGLQPTKEKIASGYLFKEHLDKAVNLLPNDSTIHHMLGRFAYEIASLKWYERKVAAAFFAEPPNATYDEALNHFLSAEQLTQEDWKENKLYIAKCLVALARYKEAVETLRDAEKITSESDVDAEVQVLLQKYNSYG